MVVPQGLSSRVKQIQRGPTAGRIPNPTDPSGSSFLALQKQRNQAIEGVRNKIISEGIFTQEQVQEALPLDTRTAAVRGPRQQARIRQVKGQGVKEIRTVKPIQFQPIQPTTRTEIIESLFKKQGFKGITTDKGVVRGVRDGRQSVINVRTGRTAEVPLSAIVDLSTPRSQVERKKQKALRPLTSSGIIGSLLKRQGFAVQRNGDRVVGVKGERKVVFNVLTGRTAEVPLSTQVSLISRETLQEKGAKTLERKGLPTTAFGRFQQSVAERTTQKSIPLSVASKLVSRQILAVSETTGKFKSVSLFGLGQQKGFISSFKDRPIEQGLLFAGGGLLQTGRRFLQGTVGGKALLVGEVGLGATVVGFTGIEIAAAKDSQTKGTVIGRLQADLLSFGSGAKTASAITDRIIGPRIIIKEKIPVEDFDPSITFQKGRGGPEVTFLDVERVRVLTGIEAKKFIRGGLEGEALSDFKQPSPKKRAKVRAKIEFPFRRTEEDIRIGSEQVKGSTGFRKPKTIIEVLEGTKAKETTPPKKKVVEIKPVVLGSAAGFGKGIGQGRFGGVAARFGRQRLAQQQLVLLEEVPVGPKEGISKTSRTIEVIPSLRTVPLRSSLVSPTSRLVSLTGLRSSTRAKQITTQIQRQKTISSQSSISRQIQKSLQGTKQITAAKQITITQQKQLQKLLQLQRTQQLTRTQSIQLTKLRLLTRTKTVLEPPPPLLLKLRKKSKTKLGIKNKGFIAQVKAKGRFRDASINPLPRNKAINLASRIADQTTARSFRIKPKGRTKIKDDPRFTLRKKFRGRVGKSKLPPRTFVEKSKFAIDTRGERAGIPFNPIRIQRLKESIARRKLRSIRIKKATRGSTKVFL